MCDLRAAGSALREQCVVLRQGQMPHRRGGEVDSRKNSEGEDEALLTTCRIAFVGYSDPVVSIPVIPIKLQVTGIPPENSEDFQILKYEPGQFYRQHHDYIEFQRDRR